MTDQILSKTPTEVVCNKYKSAYRWSLAVAITIFPLIWMGGLVTTHDAGMAVPDWPGTYGYNLLLYPVSTWLTGPFDLFVEHGHRLLGALTGFLAIGLVWSVWRGKLPAALMKWSLLLLLAIILQGALGGERVLQVNRIMAMVHGCTGPLVFALACYVVLLIRRVRDAGPEPQSSSTIVKRRGPANFAFILSLFAFVQIILGASLRHLNVGLRPTQFMALTHLHLTFAAVLTLSVLTLFMIAVATRNRLVRPFPSKLPGILLLLVAIQVFLGCLTWFVNYALPWSDLSPTLSAHVNHLKGLWETMIVTAHQAIGSIILVTAFVLAIRTREKSKTLSAMSAQ